MGCLGNLLWIIFGGLVTSISWLILGCLWCITIIGIPIGLQCFKFASLSLAPFGKEVVYGGRTGSLVLNIFWIILAGIPMTIEYVVLGAAFCITIIGIPFGLQCFKLAKLSLMPFGTTLHG